jgi:hypothetical protein
MRRGKFWTGLITPGNEQFQPTPPFSGAGWQATFAPQRKKPPTVHGGQEVVLHATSWASAQRALQLIHGCHLLIQGNPDVFRIQLIANNSGEPAWMSKEERDALRKNTYSTSNFPVACAVAAKASRRRNWVTAIARYKFSVDLFSVHSVDMEPWKSPHLKVSLFPDDHVMFSHAVISAYSVLEDLRLELRASSRVPSRMKGKWNPVVRQELETRLVNSGSNLEEKVPWMARDPKRRIEKRRPLPVGTKAPWSAWVVRDLEIEVVDAIAYSSWLRSCVAAHATKDLTRVLSPYDVVNMQYLARRLILETLGFWRWFDQE